VSKEGGRSVLACLPVFRSPVRPCSLLVLEKTPIDRSLPHYVVNIYIWPCLLLALYVRIRSPCLDGLPILFTGTNLYVRNHLSRYIHSMDSEKKQIPPAPEIRGAYERVRHTDKSFRGSIKTRFLTPERKSMKA